ncbi:MAG: regulatory protein RecX [Gammaproteobacteria bacterium]|nr:regulatory protein RecX [Gammaproteobacteria bacterium]MDE2250336.1 regulatory protein RecX [Gammaproteobacteria bacterium]
MAAVAFLARRDYAAGELAAKLRVNGYESTVVATVIADLSARRLLDDARYAGHFVDYHRARGQGPLRIRRELEGFGVAGALIEAALRAVPDWAAVAREVRHRRFGPEAPAGWAEKGRQARFLQYRGFSNDHIRSALGPDLELDS